MKFVIALIALFAVSAMAQPYGVTSVYSDSGCTMPVGQFVTSVIEQCTVTDACTQFGTGSGHYYSTVCNATALPTFPVGWVAVQQFSADCQTSSGYVAGIPDTCFIFAQQSQGVYLAANLGSCVNDNTSAVVVATESGAAAPTCGTTFASANATGVCTVTNNELAGAVTLTQCQEVAPTAPTAQPTAEPTTQPSTTPTTTTTPSTTTPRANTPSSSAAVLAASGLLSVVALLL